MLDTDKAWEQFELLEETYFKTKEMFEVPKSLPEALRYAAELAEKIEQDKPLVEFATTASQATNSILIRELAKICCKDGVETGEKRLYRKLREWGVMMPYSTEPYQQFVDKGYFEIVERVVRTNSGLETKSTTRVLPKGQIYIMNRLKGEAAC